MSGKDAEDLADSEFNQKWKAVSGNTVAGTYDLVLKDVESVREWRANGEVEADAPSTPALDRIQALCQLANVDFDCWRTKGSGGYGRSIKGNRGQEEAQGSSEPL
ncbi:hypothetical protein GGS23DRAFT_598423 [Durotheca rogersii]|uniref:uncharacterized protein n=1 Tax=Durotheca rogersii TaxID=419775 RepID=UPI002220E844|nr:uncharacterized protein GGS23DRAFT_598423 [Durotheca rogersii]KAI5861647.1 hypothetical protein GGS23DRAFT_598423 [Durotheca rogersii]